MFKLFTSLFLLLISTATLSEERYGNGSGFFITDNGYFVTNYHVIENAKKILIVDQFGYFLNTRVIKFDKIHDIAILKVDGLFKSIPITTSSKVLRGAKIVAVGYPNTSIQGVQPKVTDGLVNSLAGIKDDPRYFQISAPIQGGNSGGPLLDMNANVIGLVSAKLDNSFVIKTTGDIPQNVNYAVKSDYILDLIYSIPDAKSNLKPIKKNQATDVANVFQQVESSIALVYVAIDSNKNKKEFIAIPKNKTPQNIEDSLVWTYVSIGKDVDVYLEEKTIQRDNQFATVLTEFNYRQFKRLDDGRKYMSVVAEWTINCNDLMSKINRGAYWSQVKHKGDLVSSVQDVPILWEPIIPNSHMDLIYNKVCF
jgi:hypothetical protein